MQFDPLKHPDHDENVAEIQDRMMSSIEGDDDSMEVFIASFYIAASIAKSAGYPKEMLHEFVDMVMNDIDGQLGEMESSTH